MANAELARNLEPTGYQAPGLVLVGPRYLQAEVENEPDRETKKRYDLTTLFAEQVDGNMRTDFEFYFDGQDLIGEDGGSMDKITRNSLKEAEKMVQINPSFAYELRRRRLEREEFEELVGDGGPNTMIVVSDFPPELMNATEDVGGYNVRRKQTMLRIISRKSSDDWKMTSLNLDGSNRQALEAIYGRFGIKPQEGELLGQRIKIDLPSEQQVALPDTLRQTYDDSLIQQFGGEWYGGRRPVDRRNTYNFVLAQTDLVEECIRLDKFGWLNESFMYDVSAKMQERFEKYKEGDLLILPELSMTELRADIKQAGLRAEAAGMVFSGCGVSLGAKGSSIGSLKNGLKIAGYGNQAFDEDGDCEFVSKSCPSCGEENVQTRVTKTPSGRHVSGSCGCSKYYSDN